MARNKVKRIQIERNFDGVQFEDIRKKIDLKYNSVHDELSECYYNKKPFRNYGVLDKSTFDKLHGLVFLKRDKEFHEENLKRPARKRYPESKYDERRDADGRLVERVSERAVSRIAELKAEGIDVEVNEE